MESKDYETTENTDFTEFTEQTEEKDKEPIDIKKEIISWATMIVSAILIAFVITKFIIINATVPTGSMEDTIPTGSRIMGLRLSYLFSEPERGDIVVFEFQFEEDTNYVKRIVGLPGETVVIEDAQIKIYEGDELKEVLDEEYLKEEWVYKNTGYTFKVPEGAYFVLGDNRNGSSDTRTWYDAIYSTGQCKYEDLFIKEEAILGKVYFTYYPKFSFVND